MSKTSGKYIEEFVAFLGWEVDNKQLKEFQNQFKSMTNMVKKAATIITVGAGALSALTVITNKATAQNIKLAESFGIGAAAFENWGMIFGDVGIESAAVGKAFKTLGDKFGGVKSGTESVDKLDKSTKALGLNYKDLMNLSPEDQFKAIMQGAKDAEDGQIAAAAATDLLGREGAKMVGYLRTQSGTIDEILGRQEQLNMLTDEGRNGALSFFDSLDDATDIVTTLKAQFFGLLGGAIAPMLAGWADWMIANRAIIQSGVKRWADNLARALVWLYGKIIWIIKAIDGLVTGLGGLENTLKLLSVVFVTVFATKGVLAIMAFTKAIKTMGTAALIAQAKIFGIAALAAILFLVGEDLWTFFQGGESVVGKLGEKISDFVHDKVKPTVASFFGMTPEEFDMATVRFVNAISNFFGTTLPDAFMAGYDFMVWWYEQIIWFFLDGIPAALAASKEFIIAGVNALFDWLPSSIQSTIQFITDMFNSVLVLWGALFLDFWNFPTHFMNVMVDLATKFGAFITGLPGQIYDNFLSIIGKVGGLIMKIPFIGKIMGGGSALPPAPPPGGVPLPAPTPGAKAAAVTAGAVNNQSSANYGGAKVQNNISVVQQPGEDGSKFASRVAGEIQKTMGRATKTNKSGIEV
jgi:hypothetical protein